MQPHAPAIPADPPPLALDVLDARWDALQAVVPTLLGPEAGRAACIYVLRGARKTAPKRWRQGPRLPADLPGMDEPAVAWLAQRHVYRVEQHVAAGLLAWTRDERRLLALRSVPTPLEVLGLQAAGWRCVSLLDDDDDCGLQASPFEFALHDLCHAEHFFDPAHHAAQVGFFSRLYAMSLSGIWHERQQTWDAQWQTDWHHVASDMNGAVLFLFSALRRKAQLAAQRHDVAAPQVVSELLQGLGMEGEVAEAGRLFSVHRDVDRALVMQWAELLTAHFVALGLQVLQSAHQVPTLAAHRGLANRSCP